MIIELIKIGFFPYRAKLSSKIEMILQAIEVIQSEKK